jgi:hypothetical protein
VSAVFPRQRCRVCVCVCVGWLVGVFRYFNYCVGVLAAAPWDGAEEVETERLPPALAQPCQTRVVVRGLFIGGQSGSAPPSYDGQFRLTQTSEGGMDGVALVGEQPSCDCSDFDDDEEDEEYGAAWDDDYDEEE